MEIKNNSLTPQQPERLLSEAELVERKDNKNFNHVCIEGFEANGKELFTKGKFYDVSIVGIVYDNYGQPRRADFFFRTRHFKLISQTAQEENPTERLMANQIVKNSNAAAQEEVKAEDDARLSEAYAERDRLKNLYLELHSQTSLLQQEVEKLRELLKESKRFCGGSLQAKIDNQLNK